MKLGPDTLAQILDLIPPEYLSYTKNEIVNNFVGEGGI